MAKGASIAVNPSLLVWARKESGYDVEMVAQKLHVKEGKLVESGTMEEVKGNSSLEDIFMELTSEKSLEVTDSEQPLEETDSDQEVDEHVSSL